MKLEVEVISKQIVQPSSPTPDRLRRYQLSFLDQLTPTIYNPLVMFYPKICDSEADKIKTSDHLKHSISEALTYFYPLAGRLNRDELIVDCNDEGIPFVEARVKCRLSDVIEKPIPSELNKLFPFDLHDVAMLPMGIQFNVFECGGIGIGVCISHKIVDALSFFTFVNTWAGIARGETKLVAPEFVSAELFPPRSLLEYEPTIPKPKEKIITKRFVFTSSKVEEIRRKYSLENQKRPTRVEALSAFLWSRYVAATKLTSKPNTLCIITHVVNLRTRVDPPLPEYSVGNLYSFTFSIPSLDSGEENRDNLVIQTRESIKKVNKQFVKKLQEGYNPSNSVYETAASHAKGELLPFSFTSLCRFPAYEADFGWGKPIWAGSGDRGLNNVVTFFDTVSGNGIEAWVSLKEEDMAKFECDEELLAYINIAPKRA